ncbi:hypothetical protein NECID01_1295 [Nematocida sp. AWRm77]|nr:hypothetical protein NECID01_1295 [Nematocida sp. AWRm77]
MARHEYTNELRSKDYAEVEQVLADKKMTLFRLRTELTNSKGKGSAEWINTKKDIARCMSILGEKKKEEIKKDCLAKGLPLPKFMRPKLPRVLRVSVPKKTLEKYSQRRKSGKGKVVVFGSQ